MLLMERTRACLLHRMVIPDGIGIGIAISNNKICWKGIPIPIHVFGYDTGLNLVLIQFCFFFHFFEIYHH